MVKYLRGLAEQHGLDPHKFVRVAAPTGTAALGVHGMTLHSLATLPVNSSFQALKAAGLNFAAK